MRRLGLGVGLGRAGVFGASMPAGALGIWYVDAYDSATNAVPNAAVSAPLSSNLLRASRRLFSNTVLWNSASLTITDKAAPNAAGTANEASTFVGTGNWLSIPQCGDAFPAGTYTIVAAVMRNTTSDQPFALTGNGGGAKGVFTATSAFQRFAYTFTRTGTWPVNDLQICSSDGVTGANLVVDEIVLYAGSSDLGAQGADGNLYLGQSKNGASPTVSGAAMDLSGGGTAFIQLASQSMAAFTVIGLAQKTVAGGGWDGFFSKVQSYSDLTALAEVSAQPRGYMAGGPGAFDESDGLFSTLNQGYHAFTIRSDGTNRQMFVDDVLLFSDPTAIGAVALSDAFVGWVVNSGLSSSLQVNALALYPSALTDTQVRQAYTALKARAASHAITANPASRILVAEGDSISSGSSPKPYPNLFGPNASPKVLGNVYATGGAGISTMSGRAAQLDAIIPPGDKTGRKFILSVLIGHNDLLSGTVNGWLSNLATYLDARRAAGWTVVLCTLLPSTVTGFNTARASANPELRLWTTNGSIVPGQHADYIVDFAADATMGPDAAASNTTYYADGTHPTQAGQNLLEPIYRAVVNAI